MPAITCNSSKANLRVTDVEESKYQINELYKIISEEVKKLGKFKQANKPRDGTH